MKIHVILEPDITPDQLLEIGLLAERLDIAGLWVQNYAAGADPFMSLVPLARESSRIKLGVVIVSPYETHPAKMATSLLTLNEYSNGRASMVIGGGGEWLGIMGIKHSWRVSMVREAVEIVREAARGGGVDGTINYQGENYRAKYYRTPWVKEQTPATVYGGVTKDKMLQMGACTADGVMLADLGLPSVVAGRIDVVNKALEASGRPRQDLLINNFLGWHVKEDAQEVYREARRELLIRAFLMKDWLTPFLSEEEADFVQDNKGAFVKAYQERTGIIEGVPQDIVDRIIDSLTITVPAADSDKAVERLKQMEATGLDEISLRLHDDPVDSIRLIGERVIPEFHR
ncbi:MAG: LLM class flavin-dependent oxidoreductase [Gammaproteobacteria bacterium]|nr:LLM class flavin-dependent oxidoreductase [Gammaproteobacteria bacterium]